MNLLRTRKNKIAVIVMQTGKTELLFFFEEGILSGIYMYPDIVLIQRSNWVGATMTYLGNFYDDFLKRRRAVQAKKCCDVKHVGVRLALRPRLYHPLLYSTVTSSGECDTVQFPFRVRATKEVSITCSIHPKKLGSYKARDGISFQNGRNDANRLYVYEVKAARVSILRKSAASMETRSSCNYATLHLLIPRPSSALWSIE